MDDWSAVQLHKARSMATFTQYGLGKLQAEVLELVWEMGEASVSQLVDRIGKKRHVTYTTILAAMQKLEKKGWLTHRSEGRAYVYRAVKSKVSVNTKLLKDVLKSAFGGDAHLLLCDLLDECPLGDEELLRLRKSIDKKRKERRRG